MDVHRARFVPYPTSPITSTAFTRHADQPAGSALALRLALGRKDGSIEIWNSQNGSWTQETRFTTDGVVPETLVWTQDPDQTAFDGTIVTGQYRLFSFSSGGKVTEWDLERGVSKRQATGNLAEIWCLSAQPRVAGTERAQDLVAGCGDGTLAVLTTEDDDLQFKRYLARVSGKKARCLTIAYQKPEVLVAGFADSMIRVYDTKSGSIVRTMSLGASIPGAPKSNLVWKLLCLPNGDIVSGDSNGELRIWDGKSLSMKQRISGHDRDCLDLVASNDGETIFSCGVDGRIAAYRQSVGDRGRTTWAKSSHRRIAQQGGPVKNLAAFDGANMSVLVAASNDPAPIIAPLRGFGKEYTRVLPFLPQRTQVVSSPSARLVATWWNDSIYIYEFAKQHKLDVQHSEHKGVETLVATIQLKTSKIRTVALSQSGHLLSASTSTGVHLYQLSQARDTTALKIRKISLPDEFKENGAKELALIDLEEEGAWLAAATLKNSIIITKIVQSQVRPGRYDAASMTIELERVLRGRDDQSGFKAYNSTITQLLFSEEGTMLIAGDIAGCLDYWELHGNHDIDQKCVEVAVNGHASHESEDSSDDSDDDETETMLYGQTWRLGRTTLPKLESAPLVLTFRPMLTQSLIDSQLGEEAIAAGPRLVIVTARHQLYEFDIREGQLSTWSKQNTSSSLPPAFTQIRDRVMGAYWDPRERLWLYGSNFLFMLDVSNALPTQAEATGKRKRQDGPGVSNKRNRGSGAGNAMTNGHGHAIGGLDTARTTKAEKVARSDDNNDEEPVELALANPSSETSELRKVSDKHMTHWCTFKYRPILGIVALNHAYRPADESQDILEMVIIERPVIERKKQRTPK